MKKVLETKFLASYASLLLFTVLGLASHSYYLIFPPFRSSSASSSSAFVFHFCVYPRIILQITHSVDASLALAHVKLFILPTTPNLCIVLTPFGQISSIPIGQKASRKTCAGFPLRSVPSCCSIPSTIKPDLTVHSIGEKKKYIYTQRSLFYKHLKPLYLVTC